MKRLIFVVVFFQLFSCTNETSISTYTVSNGNFTHSMLVEGFVEPVLSTTLTTPRGSNGTVQFLVEEGEQVEEGEVVCIIENNQLANDYDQILIQLENSETGLNKTKADLNMQFALLEAQVRTNEADTKIAQMDSLQLAYVSPSQRAIKELELEKATIQKARYEKKLEALKFIQQTEIRKMELEIQRFKLRVNTMKEQLDGLTIKAPRKGMVVRTINPMTGKKLQIGDQVWSNFPIATLPEYKEMKVKITASEADFKHISMNDSVVYTFDAMPENKGSGKIIKKSPIGQPYKRGATVKFFEIEASIVEVDSMPDPGFTANCLIIMKLVENVISIPQIAVFEDDSIKVVYVQRKKGFESRQVLTDISSPTETVVTAGLEDGDVVALSKPKATRIKVHTALPDSLLQKPETPAIEPVPNNATPEGGARPAPPLPSNNLNTLK